MELSHTRKLLYQWGLKQYSSRHRLIKSRHKNTAHESNINFPQSESSEFRKMFDLEIQVPEWLRFVQGNVPKIKISIASNILKLCVWNNTWRMIKTLKKFCHERSKLRKDPTLKDQNPEKIFPERIFPERPKLRKFGIPSI